MVFRALLLVFGVFACSTSVLMIKACGVDAVLLSSYRLLVAAAALSPLFLRDLRRHRARTGGRLLARTVLPGLVLGVHFITWIVGARMTFAANASLIVNLLPVAMPFLLYALVRERLTRGELLGTGAALAGVALLAGGDFDLRPEYFLGDVVCFVSMLLYALYLALSRRNRDFPSVWLYVVPLYFVGAAACFVAALPRVRLPGVAAWWNLLMVLGLGLVPTVMGHSIMNYSLRHIRGQAVGIANLGQFLFAGLMAYALLHEVPPPMFYPACGLVVAGCVVALRTTPEPTVPLRLETD